MNPVHRLNLFCALEVPSFAFNFRALSNPPFRFLLRQVVPRCWFRGSRTPKRVMELGPQLLGRFQAA